MSPDGIVRRMSTFTGAFNKCVFVKMSGGGGVGKYSG